ncbi:MAG TPA: thioredoxin [Bacteroidia bacterium]|nr:thioredoxin [Bacteroidia bacterium]HRS59228.1 thioredoxin [Bacteroidia bacterium]HRU68890.1 thioredoxin [Bacteroidia bacterium]
MSGKYDVIDFQKDVIEESYHKPVLVDFWAAWCQPCRMLGPVLEKLAEENKDRFKLAKLDTESFPEIARQFNIRSIPAVKLFVKGKVTAEFAGALPKQAIEKFLKQHLPDKNRDELEAIKSRIPYGVNGEIIKRLENLIETSPELTEAKFLLARLIVLQNPEKARQLISDIHADSPFYLQSEYLRNFCHFMTLKDEDFEEGKVRENLIEARKLIQQSQFDKALENIIQSLMVQKEYMDGLARKTGVAIFTILGNEHAATKSYRRRFDMSLY